MGAFVILFLCVVTLIAILRYTNKRTKSYYESKGIFYSGNGSFRMISNMWNKVNFGEDIKVQYQKLKSQNVKVAVGHYFGQTSLFVNDLDLIKSILVKDFDHFSNRKVFQIPKNDVLFGKMLFALTGENWKALRSKLSPTFTTGKIKRMFKAFDQSGKKLVKFVEQQMQASQSGELDLTQAYSKYTMDVIASAACGIDSQAFNQTEASVFEEMGSKLQLQFGGFKMFKLIVMLMTPKISDFFGWSFFGTEVQDFFSGAIKSSINHRKMHNEKRDDFIQLMLEAGEGQLKTDDSELDTFEKDAIIKDKSEGPNSKSAASDLLDDDGIVANCVLFIVGGFDTTQSLLLFCAYALALNQDVQDRLRSEIDLVLDDTDGEFTCESLNKMAYLDMVINETLRYYPPAVATDRGCTQDYKVEGTQFVLKKGDGVIIPISGIHHDPEYYPNPEKFDPERFSQENKSKINQYAFLPFGQGPRNCIGMRFALTEVKVAISHLVHNFKIEPSQKTLIPMKYQNANSLKPEGGMFLALNKIH